MRESIRHMVSTLPNTKKVLVLFDSDTTAKASIDKGIKNAKNIKGFEGDITIDIKHTGEKRYLAEIYQGS